MHKDQQDQRVLQVQQEILAQQDQRVQLAHKDQQAQRVLQEQQEI